MRRKPIVAFIYDFDGTLSPGNMQEFGFIQAIGKTPEEFWKKSDLIAKGQDASNILSYMKLMHDEAKAEGITLTEENFKKFGQNIQLYDGVKHWFKLINKYGEEHGVQPEHYIISSGLTEIVAGCPIADEFKHIFAGTFIYDKNGIAEWPGVAVDYTAKTQYLFKINKGIFSAMDTVKVNESVADEDKRVPFTQMIYFGDGETDVPSMKIVNMFGGHSIAVFAPGNEEKKAAARKLLTEGRANFITPAIYTKESRTFKLACAIIDKIRACNELEKFNKYK